MLVSICYEAVIYAAGNWSSVSSTALGVFRYVDSDYLWRVDDNSLVPVHLEDVWTFLMVWELVGEYVKVPRLPIFYEATNCKDSNLCG